MKKISETVLFFGSGPVAAKSLELLAQDFKIEAVITKPRAAHHKGEVPVLAIAEKLKLPVHTAANRRELDELFSDKPFESRLGILIDFGIIVSKKVIDYFPFGIINSHFSVLPEWRGADPISFAILSGQPMTGVSLMLLVEAMDEGPLVAYGEQPLTGHETAPELTEALIQLSYALLKQGVPRYLEDRKTAPQSITGREVSYSRKLLKEDGIIDWNQPAKELEREIRAFIEWPKSQTALGDRDIIITDAKVINVEGQPGEIHTEGKNLVVSCGEQALEILKLKPIGKREMTAQEFLVGYRHIF